MRETVSPARAIEGIITLPGDKSISHRYGMLASIASGRSTIANYSTGADCQSTLACMAALGAKIERQEGSVVIQGGALQEPAGDSSMRVTRALPSACSPESWRRSRSRPGSAATNRSRAAPWRALSVRLRKWAPGSRPATESFRRSPFTRRAALAWHRLPSAHGQRAGQKLRSSGGTVRAGRHHRPRAGPHARPHRNRAEGVRRRDRNREADHPLTCRCAPDGPGAGCARRSFLGLLLHGRRAAAEGIKPGDPRRRPEPHALSAARFSGRRWARRSRCSRSIKWAAN